MIYLPLTYPLVQDLGVMFIPFDGWNNMSPLASFIKDSWALFMAASLSGTVHFGKFHKFLMDPILNSI